MKQLAELRKLTELEQLKILGLIVSLLRLTSNSYFIHNA
jgi:hypothetical protein